MEQGIVTYLATDFGSVDRTRLLCTFFYEGINYILTLEEDGDYACCEMGWNPWKGLYQITDPVSDEADGIADFLLERAEQNPDFYTFQGEHYRISDRDGRIQVRKQRKLKLLRSPARFAPLALHLIVSVLLAVLYGFFCVHTSEIMIAANLFSKLPRSAVVAIIYGIQMAGAVALLFLRRREWSFWDLWLNALIPYHLLTLILSLKASRAFRLVALAILVVSLLVWVLPKALCALKTKNKVRRNANWRVSLKRLYAPLFICMCAAFIAVHFWELPIYPYSGNQAQIREARGEVLLDEIKDRLKNTKWKEYGTQEKLDILQTVCTYECTENLGCVSPKVLSGQPENDRVYGEYSENTNTVLIDIDHLENDPLATVLDTLLHEARHAYQHAVVKAFSEIETGLDDQALALNCFKTIASFRDNFEHYYTGKDDLFAYYHQVVEYDSRVWAQERMKSTYLNFIYLTDEESGFKESDGGTQ